MDTNETTEDRQHPVIDSVSAAAQNVADFVRNNKTLVGASIIGLALYSRGGRKNRSRD